MYIPCWLFHSFCAATGVLALILFFVLHTKWRVPWKKLTEEQKNNLLQYGLIHFTTAQNLTSIKQDKTIRFGGKKLHHHIGGRYLTWFFPCTKPVDTDYIPSLYKKMIKMQSVQTECVHITGITEDMCYDFRLNNRTGHMMHVGSLKANMSFYHKTNTGWIKESENN